MLMTIMILMGFPDKIAFPMICHGRVITIRLNVAMNGRLRDVLPIGTGCAPPNRRVIHPYDGSLQQIRVLRFLTGQTGWSVAVRTPLQKYLWVDE